MVPSSSLVGENAAAMPCLGSDDLARFVPGFQISENTLAAAAAAASRMVVESSRD